MSDSTPLTPGLEAPASSDEARAPEASRPGRTAAASPLERSSYAVATNRGFGDAMGRGLELALTLVVMGGFGWLVDRLVGTYPLFLVIFSVLGFAGISAKLWLGYDLEMRKLDAASIWTKNGEGAKPVNAATEKVA